MNVQGFNPFYTMETQTKHKKAEDFCLTLISVKFTARTTRLVSSRILLSETDRSVISYPTVKK